MLALKTAFVMYGNLNVSQAMSQQLFKVTTFCIDTRFKSFASDQLHHPPCSAEIQPMSQQAAAAPPQLVRIII